MALSLTVIEEQELRDNQSLWNKIEAMREASNLIEARINSLQTVEEIQNYDIANNPLWPE